MKTKSNERNILYLDTYPTDPESEDYLELIAHEFQHMIHYHHNKNELTWVNEGCSQIAPVFCGYAPPGHYRILKESSNRSLNNWATWDPMPDYGKVYLWNQFIVDQILRTEKERQLFFTTLVKSQRKSIGGYIDAFSKFNTTFTEMFKRFSVANHVNDYRLENGNYSYRIEDLNNFKLPPFRHINYLPSEQSAAVNIWDANSFFVDISNFTGKLKIDFSGFKRFLGPTHPCFEVAIVLQSSANTSKPTLKYMQIAQNPENKSRMIGEIVIDCDGSYDVMHAIVMALAPEHVDDTEYMPASPFIFDINFTPIVTPQDMRASINFSMSNFVQAAKNQETSESTIKVREYYANLLLRTAKREIEQGSLATIDKFISSYQENPHLAPYARDIRGMLNYYLNMQTAPILDSELEARLEQISNH